MNHYVRALLKRYYRFLSRVDVEKYKREYPVFLNRIGIDIPLDYRESGHGFIAASVVFDANDYSLISIGKATTISEDVLLLTHDYSISKGLKLIDPNLNGRFLRPIRIGENSFIGIRSIILPGTTIGNNVIVGAGSIVKGTFPDNVVIAGNPAKVICSTEAWARKHFDHSDFDLL